MINVANPSAVHPENRVDLSPLPQPSKGRAGKSPLQLIAGGIFCGLLGATLGTMLMSAEIAAGDDAALVAMIPLAATVVAVVTGWAAAMILVGPGEERSG